MKVVKPETNTTGENVLERLEQAVEYAKEHPVQNVVIVMVSETGVVDAWANGSKPFHVVGALESVKREFMDKCIG